MRVSKVDLLVLIHWVGTKAVLTKVTRLLLSGNVLVNKEAVYLVFRGGRLRRGLSVGLVVVLKEVRLD